MTGFSANCVPIFFLNLVSSLTSPSVAKQIQRGTEFHPDGGRSSMQCCRGSCSVALRMSWDTYGYMAIVVSLTKRSLFGASTVLQEKACGGGILCFLQKSAGEMPYSCLTSCKSDLAAITKQGILLSMKCCYEFKLRGSGKRLNKAMEDK